MGITNLDSLELGNTLSVTGTALFSGEVRVASAANGICGKVAIPAGGTAAISSTKIATATRLFLNVQSGASTLKKLHPYIVSVATGKAVVGLATGAGTAATGVLHWLAINQ